MCAPTMKYKKKWRKTVLHKVALAQTHAHTHTHTRFRTHLNTQFNSKIHSNSTTLNGWNIVCAIYWQPLPSEKRTTTTFYEIWIMYDGSASHTSTPYTRMHWSVYAALARGCFSVAAACSLPGPFFFVASLLRHPVRFIKNSTLKLHRFHCQTHTFFHPSGSGVIYFISNQSWYFAGSLELFLLKMKIQYKWIEQRRDEEMWTSSDINHATMKPPKKQSENTNTVQGMRHCNLFHGFLWRNIELFYVQYPYGRQIIFYSWNLDFSAPLRFIHSICIYELCSLLKRRHKHLYCTH